MTNESKTTDNQPSQPVLTQAVNQTQPPPAVANPEPQPTPTANFVHGTKPTPTA